MADLTDEYSETARLTAIYAARPISSETSADGVFRDWRRVHRLGDSTMREVFAAGFYAGLAHAESVQWQQVRDRLAQLRAPSVDDSDASHEDRLEVPC